jgi:hypothetical protein
MRNYIMANARVIRPTFSHSDENQSGPEADQLELSRRGLLVDEEDREALPEDGIFLREVQLPVRSRGGRPTGPPRGHSTRLAGVAGIGAVASLALLWT